MERCLQMRRFVRNVAAFFLPFFLIAFAFSPLFFAIINTGEFDSIEENIRKQRKDSNRLMGLGYNEQTAYYKLLNVNEYQPEIFSLGTSRVMQFKGACLFDFYNCGGAVSGNYDEYKNFLSNLTYRPKCIIVGLDAWVFNDAWNKTIQVYDEYQEIGEVNRTWGALFKAVIDDWLTKKWTCSDLNNYPQNIGFNGRVKDEGFMNDGSYYYGERYRFPSSSPDYAFADTLNRISNGNSRFEWGENIDSDTIVQLNELLSYCKHENINVIGFLAPFAPSIFNVMQQSGHYEYLEKIAPTCMQLFEKYNFEFYDYMDGASLGLTDQYFIDGFHGSEIVYAHILQDMAEHNSEIKKYFNSERTRELLENAYSEILFEAPEHRTGQ